MKTRYILVLPLLGAVILLSGFLAAACFDTALRAKELWPWLISETEPWAEGIMTTLEEKQFQRGIAGIVCLLPGLCALAGGSLLVHKKREGNK